MFAIVLTGLLVLLLLLIIVWYVIKWVYDKKLWQYDGPRSWPILGNALDFEDSAKIMKSLMKYMKDYNGSFKLMLGFQPNLIICDYKTVEFLLTSSQHITKSDPYKNLDRWLGTGLLTGTGEKWKKSRKMITPAFHFKILDSFIDGFNSASDILVEKLQEGIRDGDTVDIYNYVTNFTLDVICDSAMGISLNAQNEPKSDYIDAVKEICRIMIVRTFSPLKQFDALYFLSFDYRRELACLKCLDATTSKVIKDRRQMIGELGITTTSTEEESAASYETGDGVKKKYVFLDTLLRATIDGKPLTDKEVMEQVNTFMFAGHDTTAAAITFCLYLLSKHPEVQEKVVEELRTIFGSGEDRNRAASHQDLQDMKYLEQVIKETLRLYPSVPAVGRSQNYPIKYEEGKVIPANVPCVIFLYGLHRDPQYFPDPEKFNPERFSPGNELTKLPYAFLPFSAGPRNCIGQKFANLEMKSALAKVLRNFELFPGGVEINLIFEITLKSSTGVMVKLKKRTW